MTAMTQDEDINEPSSQKIKDAALRLFSSKGIEGVTVREIVAEAGVKNNASLHYYFGSKEALVETLILDCAQHSDSARIRKLDALEAAGGPRNVSDIVRLIIDVETGSDDNDGTTTADTGFGHMRFVMGLKINHRRAFMQAMAGHRTSGYLRCIEHIYALMPDTAKVALNQRLIFMDLFIGAGLAAREAAFEQDPTGGKLWGAPDALENFILSTCALLTLSAPTNQPSGAT